jgi:hypothetical protein
MTRPETWTDERLVQCSMDARLLFLGLRNFCDDAGRHSASTRLLKMEVFPADAFTDEQMTEWIKEMITAGLVESYDIDGASYWEVMTWHDQRIDRPSYQYPDRRGRTPGQRGFDDRQSARRSRSEHSAPAGPPGREATTSQSAKKPEASDEFGEFVERWNATPGVVKASKPTQKRRNAWRARCRDPDWRESWRRALAKFPLKMTAGRQNGWLPDIEWFLKPDTVTKILEGKYDWSKPDAHRPLFDDAAQRDIEDGELEPV